MSDTNIIRLKIAFIGEPGVGKKTLQNTLVGHPFHARPLYIDFTSTILNVYGFETRMTFWVCGQERFKSLPPSYYRMGDAFMVIYDVTSLKSFKRAGFWIDQVREYRTDYPPILLVANKVDLKEKRKVSSYEGNKMAVNKGVMFQEISCKENIDPLFIVSQVWLDVICHKDLQHLKYNILQKAALEKARKIQVRRRNIVSKQNLGVLLILFLSIWIFILWKT